MEARLRDLESARDLELTENDLARVFGGVPVEGDMACIEEPPIIEQPIMM
jgi:hypothetical protein